ncbi:MAG: hypothetical protein JXB33_06560 [Clostridia bacterium]|nr:hypothetical protein [Clostridia bacterium]
MDEFNPNYSVNEKLRSFTDMALREAHKRKKELVEGTELKIKQTLKEKEISLLENAYHAIQTGTRQNRRELNEAVSKALVDGKRKMFDKRRDIIEDVFKQVRAELAEYKKTTAYPMRIVENLLESIKIIDDSGYIVEACPGEEELLRKIVSETGLEAEIKASAEEILGGFIIYGKNKRMRMDCCFLTKTQQAREKFLEMCRIPIEDGDLLDGQ